MFERFCAGEDVVAGIVVVPARLVHGCSRPGHKEEHLNTELVDTETVCHEVFDVRVDDVAVQHVALQRAVRVKGARERPHVYWTPVPEQRQLFLRRAGGQNSCEKLPPRRLRSLCRPGCSEERRVRDTRGETGPPAKSRARATYESDVSKLNSFARL